MGISFLLSHLLSHDNNPAGLLNITQKTETANHFRAGIYSDLSTADEVKSIHSDSVTLAASLPRIQTT